MTDTTSIDDLFVLEALDEVPGARRFLCWDRALDRMTWLWRIDPAQADATRERIERWAALDHPCVAAVHGQGQGQTPTGGFVTTQYPGATTLQTWSEGSEPRARIALLAALVEGLDALASARLAVGSVRTDVFVDAQHRPLICSVRLAHDGGPEDVLEAVAAVLEDLDLPPVAAQTIAAADDLPALRRAVAELAAAQGEQRSRWRGWAGGLFGVLLVGGLIGGLWPRERAIAEDPCRDAAAAAARWEAEAPAVAGEDGAQLRTWLQGWSQTARDNCADGVDHTASAELVAARGQCLDEHLAALRGVWTAAAEHRCVAPSCATPRDLLPPADACAWGHAEAYLHRPWRQRPVAPDTLVELARWRTMASLGVREPVREALEGRAEAELAPRWQAWFQDTRARLADDDEAWRRASWASVVAAIEAGDELGALDAMLARARQARQRGVTLHPSPEVLAETLADRVVSSYGGGARVQAWVDRRRPTSGDSAQ